MNTFEKFNKNIMPTYGRYELSLLGGIKRRGIGEDGKEYIDFGSGIGTNSLGYCDEDWAEAVCTQVRRIQHTSNYYYNKTQADFASKLCEITGYSKVFIANSGAEANECAIKIARKYSFDKYGKGRHTIITLQNSFHGRTLCTLSATGQDSFHNYFFPFMEGFEYAAVNDIDDLRARLRGNVCAVMLEFIQGEGGVIPLDPDYVKQIYGLCAEKDVLLIADEIQTGVGRTGMFLAAEHYGVKPDITTLAKGLAGGLPIGVCVANEKCADVLVAGTHGSTFGGNPVCCAGGLVVLEKVSSSDFLSEVSKKHDYITERLSVIDEIADISGLGLMLGLSLKSKKAADIVKLALEKGLLLLTAKDKVRLLPPLNISYDEIDTGIKILNKIL